MYTLIVLTAPSDAKGSVEARLRRDMEWLVPLTADLSAISPLFAGLGLISGNTQGWINAKIAEHEADDDLSPELIEAFNRLSCSERVTLLQDPAAFADLTLGTIRKMRADGYDGNRISATTGGLAINASLTRIDYDAPQDRGVLSIDLPMQGKTDLWFAEPAIMQALLEAILTHAPGILWACAYPSMYVGRQKQLYRDRQNFGWFGYSTHPLTERGPLFAVWPAGQGTLMQLKPDMMTLHAADIDLCNAAEAFLGDKGILPYR